MAALLNLIHSQIIFSNIKNLSLYVLLFYENTLHSSNTSLSLILTIPESQQELILLIFNRRETQRKFIYIQRTKVKKSH